MSEPRRIWLVRHGETEGQSSIRYHGSNDVPLSDVGRAQIRALAPWLQGVDFATSGIPTEQQYVDAYLKRVGRGPVEDWNFYVSFSEFRLASMSQGVYRRVLAGVAASTREAVNGTPHLAKQALDILHGRL